MRPGHVPANPSGLWFLTRRADRTRDPWCQLISLRDSESLETVRHRHCVPLFLTPRRTDSARENNQRNSVHSVARRSTGNVRGMDDESFRQAAGSSGDRLGVGN